MILKEIIKPIQRELIFFEKIFIKSLSTDITLLIKISNYIFQNPGKRIRPILVFLTSGLNGKISAPTYRASILIEILQIQLK